MYYFVLHFVRGVVPATYKFSKNVNELKMNNSNFTPQYSTLILDVATIPVDLGLPVNLIPPPFHTVEGALVLAVLLRELSDLVKNLKK